jgi:hypothetical protein
MPIRSFLQESATFDDKTTAAIVEAFEDACVALQVIDKPGRSVITARVIDLARIGVLDAAVLRDRIIKEAQEKA